MKFEEKLKQLEEIVKILEDENTPLDIAIVKFEEGMNLMNELKDYLKKAEEKIKLLLRNEEGKLNLEDGEIN
uniref:Exodeoxyribonuclease 7 small subunit n=1 Tax=candidate division WOR-3 bacterium TaxID=2052148 RepID=A0A7C4UDE3_UNCW3